MCIKLGTLGATRLLERGVIPAGVRRVALPPKDGRGARTTGRGIAGAPATAKFGGWAASGGKG